MRSVQGINIQDLVSTSTIEETCRSMVLESGDETRPEAQSAKS